MVYIHILHTLTLFLLKTRNASYLSLMLLPSGTSPYREPVSHLGLIGWVCSQAKVYLTKRSFSTLMLPSGDPSQLPGPTLLLLQGIPNSLHQGSLETWHCCGSLENPGRSPGGILEKMQRHPQAAGRSSKTVLVRTEPKIHRTLVQEKVQGTKV